MSEENGKQSKPEYDFDFITQSLGLIPIGDYGAINPGAIIGVEFSDGEGFNVILHGGKSFTLTDTDMAELEATIKQRAEQAKLIQKEAIKQNLKAQAEAVAELQQGVQPGMIVGAPTGKKWGRH